MNSKMESGFLSLYIGPMYSGKTSKLLELYKQFEFCDIPTLVINYKEDTRYTKESMLSTHDQNMIPCVLTDKLETLTKTAKDYDIILINEGQFFKDIVVWVKMMVSQPFNKKVYICGLDGDFKRHTFGNWLKLIPFCDEVTKLTSICCGCKKEKAIFSHRTTKDKKQKVIGSNIYIPLCRRCYDLKNE